MKKLFVVFVLVWLLVFSACTKKSLNLNTLVIDSRFPKSDLLVFKEKLDNFDKYATWDKRDVIVQRARLNRYLWNYGKSILIYEDFLKNNSWTMAVYNNIAILYDWICLYSGNVYIDYCNKADYYYNTLINKYNRFEYYKNLYEMWWKVKNTKKVEKYKNLYNKKNNK